MKTMYAAVLTALSLSVFSAELNMFRNGSFAPCRMDGEETAAKGWNYIDFGRMYKVRKRYLSGYDCFKLFCK